MSCATKSRRRRLSRLRLEALEQRRMLAFGTPLVDVPGLDSAFNPPDPVGDIGPNHYVQMVNASFYQVNDRSGAIVQAATAVDSLGTGVCATGRGDPIVIYDHLADRWLLSEFAQKGDDTLCVYVSQTPDPTGTYFEYQVPTPNFPDYPKFALANDAYFVGTNETDTPVYALPRQQMLAGPGATITPIRRTATDLPNWQRNHITPVDLDGPAAPAGSPGLYVRQVDDEITDPAGANAANDFLEIWEFQPDFVTPANSTFSLAATVSINDFDYNLCNWSRDCLPQPGTTATIDALPHYVNNRAQYRNFGTHETLMVSFTEDVGVNQAGLRWVELRDSGAGWTVFQEGTVAPDGDSRWMGAISMNGKGDVAMMYSVTGTATMPSVRYIGRLAGDPLGTMPRGEFALPGGTGTGVIDFRPCTDSDGNPTNSECQRWGDYSAMSVDPVDDTTFWFTGMYAESNGTTDTRIGAVAFDEAPVITSLALSALSIDENDMVTLTGEFEDWNSLDDHTVVIDWKDGSPNTVINLDSDVTTAEMFMASHQYFDDHPLTGTPSDNFDIMVTVTDSTGLSDDGTLQVTVNNLDPVIVDFASDATFEDKAEEGEPVNILANFTDIGTLDTHTAVVDWGDGMVEAVTVNQGAGSGTVTGSHAYVAGGIYTITVTLTDDDTGSATAETTAVVTGVGLNNGVLYIIGSSADDVVSANQTGKGLLKVHASFIPEAFRSFDVTAVDKIISYLCDGDDHLTISNRVTTPAIIHGGDGDDHLNAGGGPTVLLGGNGDDTLVGQGGRNILIGGLGMDRLIGGKRGDVLIGGSTTSDEDDDALMAVAMAWNSGAEYELRALAIFALLAEFDDGDEDILTGSSRRDLFYDGTGDKLTDVKSGEMVIA